MGSEGGVDQRLTGDPTSVVGGYSELSGEGTKSELRLAVER